MHDLHSNLLSPLNVEMLSQHSTAGTHWWQPHVHAGILSSTAHEAVPSITLDLPARQVVPGVPPGLDSRYSHHTRYSIKAGESEGPVTSQSSVIGNMTRYFDVVVLCKSEDLLMNIETCMLIPQDLESVVDLVSSYRDASTRVGNRIDASCHVSEVGPASGEAYRVFELPAQIVAYPGLCTLSSFPANTNATDDLFMPGDIPCTVDLSLTPAWNTSKIPNLGSSFTAKFDEKDIGLPTTVEVYKEHDSVAVVSNWRRATLEGTRDSRPGAVRYVYTMSARDTKDANAALEMSPESLSLALEQARYDTTQALAKAGISLEFFTRLPTAQVDYRGPRIAIPSVAVFGLDSPPEGDDGLPKMDFFDVTVEPQCKFGSLEI